MKIPKTRRELPKKVLAKIHELEQNPGNKGKFAAIELTTGDDFLGETLTETLKKAREKYPDRLFYCVRVGYPFICRIKQLAAA